MRVAYTSDLHVDYSPANQRLASFLATRVAELDPDVFVLAGDVASSLAGLEIGLAAFGGLACLKVMVPGNHDVWVESRRAIRRGQDSWYKYLEAIPMMCRNHGFEYPVTAPVVVGNTAIVGSIGWYDYSLQDPRLAGRHDSLDYSRGEFGGTVWNDARYAVWLKMPSASDWRIRSLTLRNPAVCERMLEQLRSCVDQIPPDTAKVLVVLHTAPFRECIEPKLELSPFDAYEGSAKLGEYIEDVAAARQVAVVCGHRDARLHLDRGNVRVYRSPVGYLDTVNPDYEAIARDAVGEFCL